MGKTYKAYAQINGLKQGMIIDECSNTDAPVALFIHGGPGSPEHVMLSSFLPETQDFMTTCYHEQRGSSLSYDKHMDPNLLTTAIMLEDCVHMIDYLREKYNKEKIIVIGHSWGSYLGYQLIQTVPEKIQAYIGIGQIGNQFEGEWDTVHYLLEKTEQGDLPKLRKTLITHRNDPDFVRGQLYMKKIRAKGLNHFGGGLTAKPDTSLNKQLLKAMWSYPYYSWGDKWRYLYSAFKNMKHLMKLFDEVLSRDLVENEINLELPFYIFQGRFDYQTSYKQALRLFERTHAPHKKMVTFKDGAHAPMIEDPLKYRESLLMVIEETKA